MTDYGYSNGWTSTPEQVKECRNMKHEVTRETIGRCLTRISCPICGYFYRVDSSD